ncbi:MAG: lantibiotic immunity ABC transporter MutG family permease subunit [Clostridia bacterium]
MKLLMRIIKSDGYKAVHSTLLLVHLLVPLFGLTVFLAYYTVSPWNEAQKIAAYLQVVAMAFPLIIGIVTVMESEREKQAGGCQMLLSVPGKKTIPHFSKLTVLLLLGLLSSILAVLGFGIFFILMGNVEFSLSLYSKATMLLLLGNLPLYMLQYIISFACSKGVGLSLGIVGSLLSALFLTGLGDRIWPFLPWSIAVRLCSMLVNCETGNASFINDTEVMSALVNIVISTAALLLFLVLWSAKWEGKRNDSE